jgi:hypothetical protein
MFNYFPRNNLQNEIHGLTIAVNQCDIFPRVLGNQTNLNFTKFASGGKTIVEV